jgi:hypothetical protein
MEGDAMIKRAIKKIKNNFEMIVGLGLLMMIFGLSIIILATGFVVLFILK